MTKVSKYNQGFTLIELLIAVAIIAILSGIILTALNGSRTKSRDAKLISEIRSLRTALELYYAKYGYYPTTGGTYTCTAGTGSNACTPGVGVLQVLVTEGLISKIPIGNGATGTAVNETEIYYGSPGWWNSNWGYQIQFQVTGRNDTLGDCNGACPSVFWPGYYSYSVHP